jgi:hypothetical protein
MKPLQIRRSALVLGPLFAVILGVLLYLQDTKPRGSLRTIDGEIVSRTPITTKGKLTGLRICVGPKAQTFTYSDPDPDVDRVWGVITNATRARVQYSQGVGKNPVLWGLAANGEVLATTAQLEDARRTRYFFYVVGFAIALGGFAWAVLDSARERRQGVTSAAM